MSNQHRKRWSNCSILALLFAVLLNVTNAYVCHAKRKTPFPTYHKIRPNVEFWKKIYSTYSLNERVIHDSDDLSKVYEVISVFDESIVGAKRINAKIQKKAIKKYKRILKKLSKSAPVTKTEKKVAAMFKGRHAKKNMAKAADNLRIQSGQKERFLGGVIESGAYLSEMKRIFRSYGLPEELAYLPHVESSFNTKAYSKFGAAGAWQFTRTTGKKYLTINYSLDERLDPILATHAAAKYLKKSHTVLGTWPLALTSYNYGLSGMLRAKKAKRTYVKIFQSYRKGYFKFASRNFYSEFLAALDIAKKLEMKTNIRVKEPGRFNYFKANGYVHIYTISKHFNMTLSGLEKLNPALRTPILRGEKLIPKGYSIRLPSDNTTKQKISSFPKKQYKSKQKTSKYYRVRKGDTAGSIAKRHKVSLKSLMKANNLDADATIYFKQKLRIPTKQKISAKPKDSAILIATTKKTKRSTTLPQKSITILLPEKIKQRPTSKQTENYFPKKDPSIYNVFSTYKKKGARYGYVVVQPEESLDNFSNWLLVAKSTIRSLNKISPDATIYPGQKILVPLNKVSINRLEEKRLDLLQELEDDFFTAYSVIGKRIYTVQAGDTLWGLCHNKFDIPLWLLERYNSSLNLSALPKNQKLVIPLVKQR